MNSLPWKIVFLIFSIKSHWESIQCLMIQNLNRNMAEERDTLNLTLLKSITDTMRFEQRHRITIETSTLIPTSFEPSLRTRSLTALNSKSKRNECRRIFDIKFCQKKNSIQRSLDSGDRGMLKENLLEKFCNLLINLTICPILLLRKKLIK